MKATKLGDKIQISFPYDHRIIMLVKSFSGREYSPATKAWYIPITGAMLAIKKLQMWKFEIDPAVLEAAREDEETAREAESLAVMDDVEFETPLPLFPYQKVGAAFLYKIGSGLLGDQPGLGKTIQSLAVCEKVKAEKVLIFTPSAVKWQWLEEITKFIPINSDGVVISGNKDERVEQWREDHRFYVANYELLLRDFDNINCREWDVIIADEATKISNPMAKQSKVIKKLRAKRRLALTGTPINNRAQDIFNIIDWISPGIFGNYYSFLNEYCLKNRFGGIYGYQNMDELSGKLKRYMIRRLTIDVLPELPAKIVTDIPFELSEEEKGLYKKLKQEILFEINKEDIAKVENPMTLQFTLVKMTRLRQLADSMELLGYNKKSSKMEVLRELLQENVENGRKAIIFTQFAEMADILERELQEYGPLKISGKVSGKYKDIVSDFNENENKKILILTSAGQYGLNIQRASILFHYDQEWSLAKMIQRTGRAHRIGQKEVVQEFHLLAKGTMDYYVKKVLHGKAELSNQLLGDTPISMNDIKDILNYE